MADMNVTPADIAGNIQNPVNNIQIATAPAATPTPAQPADYKQYKGIYNAYDPAQQFISQQKTAVDDRYAANAADIKNLFGTLTTLREQDKLKIQQQATDVIVAQQAALAGRTAEVRVNQRVSAKGAQQAAGELGGGPAGDLNALANRAAERGIAQSNATATNWQGLLGSQAANAVQNIQGQQAAYGGQQAQITKDLGLKRESQLMQLEGQQAQLNQQIAQAKADYDSAIQQGNAQAAQKAMDRANAYNIQLMRSNTAVQVAQMKIDNPTTPVTGSGVVGWTKKVEADGKDPKMFIDSANKARADYRKANANAVPTSRQLVNQWKANNPGYTATDLAYFMDYIKATNFLDPSSSSTTSNSIIPRT
jgi:hypothetical protein